MNRITTQINKLHSDGTKAFIPFITAGYPDLKTTPLLVETLEKAGASIVELGMPFSDPLADGPTIQSSSFEAIRNGTTPDAVLDCIQTIRKTSEVPIILFTYTNLILRYEIDRFMERLSASGGDGLLVPDLPIEEAQLFIKSAHKHNLRMIFLISPLTSPQRMKKIEKISDDFVYCVSITGVTGKREQLFEKIKPYLQMVRKTISKPFMVGFGVSNRDDARKIAALSDGVVVGSALINIIKENINSPNLLDNVRKFALNIHRGISY